MLQEFPPAANDASDWNGYRELLGETLCQVGQSKDGLALLDLALAAAEQNGDHPNAPWLARLRAVKGLCTAAAGDRATALRNAAQARAAFTAQPGVSPYYKAPLFKLERALGLRLPAV
ncbi:MAG: hypothetical protein IPP87_07495 [Ideonella sp.]|nr:hypothetical protein [Ideonella sp.]